MRNRTAKQFGRCDLPTISSNLINEGKVSTSWAAQRIPPANDDWKRDNYGFTFQQVFPNGGPYEQSIPNVTFSGGYTGFEGAAASLLAPTVDITAADTISWIKGLHTIKSGIIVVRNRQDQNSRSLYAGNISFNNAGNPMTTNNGLADALLGNFRTYPPDDRRGIAGVGMVEGPGRFFWNLSLRKRFTLTERFNMQFLGDFFNVLNHVNLNNPNLNRDSSAVGTITGTAPARNIQIGLKLSF